MFDWFSVFTLLAQDEKQAQGNPLAPLLFPMVAIGLLWYFLILRPQNRERRSKDDLLKALKKNDRVVTIGGIIGSVAHLSPDGKEVTLKIDDNTRIKFLRSSIQTVQTETAEEDSAQKS